ncbi:hypothetical protein ITP53_02025 [Nonomuraea sp. K274]|uniref:Uncharacterized protein n=1 Tax=Nonomuraea cypriaca TaxID=1187855 RepID=A0A931A1M4_9ACTN|nr:hypothetical protein [Nonomuraea cypriaca]MBF8184542.1 hypothetical protein [Nonomuraea cypriaca]
MRGRRQVGAFSLSTDAWEGPFGGPIAHGHLTLSLVPHLLTMAPSWNGPRSPVGSRGADHVKLFDGAER